MPKKIVIAFDAYGTLLSTESIAKQLASHFGEDKSKAIAATWRKHQLEYTWRLNSMDTYEDFSALTRRSLQNALAESSVSLSDTDLENLMTSYNSLSTFPDVAKCLQSLQTTPDIDAVVFSNGTHAMVSASVQNSPDLAPYASHFSQIVTVEGPRKFKPAPETYTHLAESVGKDSTDPDAMRDLWLVSGNAFDIVGARKMGMNAVWVDRAGIGWQDRLVEGSKGRPTVIVRGLEDVVAQVMSGQPDTLTEQWREMHGDR